MRLRAPVADLLSVYRRGNVDKFRRVFNDDTFSRRGRGRNCSELFKTCAGIVVSGRSDFIRSVADIFGSDSGYIKRAARIAGDGDDLRANADSGWLFAYRVNVYPAIFESREYATATETDL